MEKRSVDSVDLLERAYSVLLKKLEKVHGEKMGEMKVLHENLLQDVLKHIGTILQGKDGIDGKHGKDGIGIIGPAGKDGSPDTAEQVRDKLESLKEENRLDASAIKNLPEFIKEKGIRVIGGHGPLWGLEDVDVVGITVGQSIKWDGIRWIPFTPSGSTGTSVYNEVVSGSGTTFTLAHTPILGTVRVYANGQRLTPTVDYSITGAVITTVSSWSAGMITADYQY